MTKPRIAQRGPNKVKVKMGKSYAWCACGRGAEQPFCGSTHKGTDIRPIVWKATKDETMWLCGCKYTGMVPECDGSHEAV
ncbi:MAG: CDGSH iron-sulfur domain-containing protein [Alphaproteobacteria bacterium]|jgi:CDGSH-type Zn-finger protein|nr:CDGSH iron-sulfur domain-containing protein [Alphaproteobacteria bacterium]MDP6239136.1 CDGSH iron-sulfur domain-containing protein [Alphaproteobacteria bacterium]MDP7173445.1 CDGSH iron-sulfur domain-containing protein [Alphaproteobacteria bacterium]MDP7232688.1 CDGSH iron-sulfur domain-containing protein [Alphaproteobacteria bacterium]MDP7487380.1 CDGSH iron-sulfur domain-containing protein [Alphaproteobacteria bacterium]